MCCFTKRPLRVSAYFSRLAKRDENAGDDERGNDSDQKPSEQISLPKEVKSDKAGSPVGEEFCRVDLMAVDSLLEGYSVRVGNRQADSSKARKVLLPCVERGPKTPDCTNYEIHSGLATIRQ
jgi:hypothetical protein